MFLDPEPGVCFDESPDCEKFAKEGKCTSSGLHHYGNYCKRSCGLCGKYATRVLQMTVGYEGIVDYISSPFNYIQY